MPHSCTSQLRTDPRGDVNGGGAPPGPAGAVRLAGGHLGAHRLGDLVARPADRGAEDGQDVRDGRAQARHLTQGRVHDALAHAAPPGVDGRQQPPVGRGQQEGHAVGGEDAHGQRPAATQVGHQGVRGGLLPQGGGGDDRGVDLAHPGHPRPERLLQLAPARGHTVGVVTHVGGQVEARVAHGGRRLGAPGRGARGGEDTTGTRTEADLDQVGDGHAQRRKSGRSRLSLSESSGPMVGGTSSSGPERAAAVQGTSA